MRPKKRMRRAEEACKYAVDKLLKEHGVRPEWCQGDEPPDYFVSLGNLRVAVEVTCIHGSTNLDGKARPWTGLTTDLLRFGEAVTDEVKSRVAIPGSYFLALPPMPKLKEHKGQIVQALIAYFEKEALQAAANTTSVILRPTGKDVVVWKFRTQGSALDPMALPAGGFINRREDQLTKLLKTTIQDKAGKLCAVSKPWWLVILDYYLSQGSMDEWRARLPTETAEFAAVLRVQNGTAQLVSGAL